MSKKRKLSPPGSTRSSLTPAPVSLPPQVTVSSHLDQASSPIAEPFSAPGPSRTSASATPAPVLDKAEAKNGTLIAGSGDGGGQGDECYLWADLPMNKQGFRYLACGLSPTPSPVPEFPFHRTVPGPSTSPLVHLSWLDRSYFLKISSNAITVTTDRGYRSGRANIAVRQGSWYYEAIIERGDGDRGEGGGTGNDAGNAHVRLGWGRREANLDAPVGMDGYGYAMRDVAGEAVHISRAKAYGRSFGTGDVIGCLISLPPREEGGESIRRKRVPIRYKGQLYFEMDEYGVQKEMEALVDREGKAAAAAKAAAEAAKDSDVKAGAKVKKGATTKNAKKGKNGPVEPTGPVARALPTLEGSHIEFFLNGEPLGTAFEDLYDFTPLPLVVNQSTLKKSEVRDILHDDGTMGYFPMVSCFGRGKVRCNFGPEWIRPPVGVSPRPMSERWDDFRAEEQLLDERDEERDTTKLEKELKASEAKRLAAEAKMQAIRESGGLKKKPAPKKKRKGTNTPTPAPESVAGDDVKLEVDSSADPRSRAGTEEPVKVEDATTAAEAMDVDVVGEDEHEGVVWEP